MWGGEGCARANLEEQVRQDGEFHSPLLVARIKGEDSLPVLYDGYGRLDIYRRLLGTKNEIALPEIVEHEFASMAEVVTAALRTQMARRNLTEAQAAQAAIEAARLFTKAKPRLRPRGRPTKSSALGFPKAEVLAEQAGVSDYTIRVMVRAQKHPKLLRRAVTDDPSLRMSVRQLEQQMRRDVHAAGQDRRQAELAKRRAKIATMPVITVPTIVKPSGIYCGDTIELMAKIEPDSVGLIMTSPPYPIECFEYDSFRFRDYEAYLNELIRPFVKACCRVLKSSGRLVVNFDLPTTSGLKSRSPHPEQVENLYDLWTDLSWIARRELGLKLLDRKTWYRQCAAGKHAFRGSRDCRAPRGNFNDEFLLVFAKDTVTIPGPVSSDITASEYDRFSISDWYIKPQHRLKPTDPDHHPCPYAEELCYRALRLYCQTTDTVLDPFNGSGTTCFVARALGRPYIGLDNSPLYCETAQKRLATLDGLSAAEMIKKIKRFVPAEGERSDGRLTHKVVGPK